MAASEAAARTWFQAVQPRRYCAQVQELADAIGTVREVVSRSIRHLRDEGLIARDGHRLVIVDAERLHLAALGQPD